MVWDRSHSSPHKQETSQTISSDGAKSGCSSTWDRVSDPWHSASCCQLNIQTTVNGSTRTPSLWLASIRQLPGYLTAFNTLLPFPIPTSIDICLTHAVNCTSARTTTYGRRWKERGVRKEVSTVANRSQVVRSTRYVGLLTADRMQLPRCPRSFLPAHQDRRPPRRLLHRVQEAVGQGVERFVEFLNHLHVTVEGMDERGDRAKPLLDTLKTSEGARCLPYRYRELLAELAISDSRLLGYKFQATYNPQIKRFFIEAQEWGKLEPSGFYGRQASDDRRGSRALDAVAIPATARSCSNGWNGGAKNAERAYRGHSNGSTRRRTGQHKRTHREFPFALAGYVLNLTMFRFIFGGFHLLMKEVKNSLVQGVAAVSRTLTFE